MIYQKSSNTTWLWLQSSLWSKHYSMKIAISEGLSWVMSRTSGSCWHCGDPKPNQDMSLRFRDDLQRTNKWGHYRNRERALSVELFMVRDQQYQRPKKHMWERNKRIFLYLVTPFVSLCYQDLTLISMIPYSSFVYPFQQTLRKLLHNPSVLCFWDNFLFTFHPRLETWGSFKRYFKIL